MLIRICAKLCVIVSISGHIPLNLGQGLLMYCLIRLGHDAPKCLIFSFLLTIMPTNANAIMLAKTKVWQGLRHSWRYG